MPVESRSQVDSMPFEVTPVHPSGVPQIADGKVTVVRQFQVKWENTEEFMLRVLGKYQQRSTETPDTGHDDLVAFPVLPARYPSNSYNLYASSVSVDMSKSSQCSFNNDIDSESGGDSVPVDDIQDYDRLEKYYFAEDSAVSKNSDLFSVVSVTYTEAEWDCTQFDGAEILVNTGVRTEVNPSYEVYTLPSRNLFFSDMTQSDEVDNSLKDDTKAYTIIPKEDIIVHWSNIPVGKLCSIYNHLSKYRGKVNSCVFGATFFCMRESDLCSGSCPPGETCCEAYEKETLLFMDYEEDFSRRTQGFDNGDRLIEPPRNNMNTTTLKLHFKCKSVKVMSEEEPGEVAAEYGWNHMPFDHSATGSDIDRWGRVKVKTGDTDKDLFEQIDFRGMFEPLIYEDT